MERGLGKDLQNKASDSRNRSVNERLNKERSKALEVLQKNVTIKTSSKEKSSNQVQKSPNFKRDVLKAPLTKPLTSNSRKSPVNKENINQNKNSGLNIPDSFLNSKKTPTKFERPCNVSSSSPTNRKQQNESGKFLRPFPLLNSTDYVPKRNREAINISDLVTDKSITIENSPIATRPSNVRDTDLSFNPAEITGRSTLHNKVDAKKQTKTSTAMSVEEILATSIAPKARNLRHSMIGINGDGSGSGRTSIASSCISGFSAMKMNPRPTSDFENKSFIVGTRENTLTFSFAHNEEAINSSVISMDFAPGELMESKLLQDEISWANKFAAIPMAVLSDEARKKALPNSQPNSIDSFMSSWNPNDSNFSVTRYFETKSDKLSSMIREESPVKNRQPIALVSDDTVSTTTTNNDNSTYTNSPDLVLLENQPNTPVVDNKTYDKVAGESTVEAITTSMVKKHDSKDSGHATDKSDLLTTSVISKALENLEVNCRNSDVFEQFLSKALHHQQNGNHSTRINGSPGSNQADTVDLVRRAEEINNMAEIILENKENLKPLGTQNVNLEDTLSFSESLLNTSIQNYRKQSLGQARSPLSPIPIVITEDSIDVVDNDAEADAADGDVDDYGNSPIITPNRRKRLTKNSKSPRNSPTLNEGMDRNEEETVTMLYERTPVNKTSVPQAVTKTITRTKSLSSTRVENMDSNGGGIFNAGISPNFSKYTNKTLTPTSQRNDDNRTADISPMSSSPCNYFSSSASSPIDSGGSVKNKRFNYNSCQNSPRFDSTSKSEQRILNAIANGEAAGRLRRFASSPSSSENAGGSVTSKTTSGNSVNSGGVPPMRSYSSNSMKSGESATTTTRSLSRCSNNSEFSHRDGKVLPLKVTDLELSWASVKLRTNSTKSLQVKNTASKRLVVRIKICGPGFQLMSPNSNMLTMQSQECRTIEINFCPTMPGPAIGELIFQSPKPSVDNNQNPNQNVTTNSGSSGSNALNSCNGNSIYIPLYAYGGHAGIMLQNIIKAPFGTSFLPMGEFSSLNHPLERSFQIFNKGPLMGFVLLCIESIALHLPGISSSFDLQPECSLIEPNTFVNVRLIFRPKRDDIKKIRQRINEVFTLANLRVIYGDEATRQRLRQVYQRMTKEMREKNFTKTLDKLWARFPGEHSLFPHESFKENIEVAQDLLGCMSVQEIALTLNKNYSDETEAELSSIFSEADNTVLFRTVCGSLSPATTGGNHLETVAELMEETQAMISDGVGGDGGGGGGDDDDGDGDGEQETAVSSSTSGHDDETSATTTPTLQWSVSPESIEFDFNNWQNPEAEGVALLVRNNFKARQYFEVTCNQRNLLQFIPSGGYIQPNGGQITVQVHGHPAIKTLPQQNYKNNDINIVVYLDNEKISVPVRVPCANSSSSSPRK